MKNKREQLHEFDDELNLRELLQKYSSRWKWFVLSLVVTFGVAVLILRYTPHIYESKTKLLIKFEKTGSYSELSAFQDLGLFDGVGRYNNLYNEREILISRPVLEKVVRKLNLNIQYLLIGTKTGIERKEFYKNSPIRIQRINDSLDIETGVVFNIEVINSELYRFLDSEKFGNKKYHFGDTLEAVIGKFCIQRTAFYKAKHGPIRIGISVKPIKKTVSIYQSKLKIEPINENVDILMLTISGPVIKKNNDFLDTLMAEHTRQTVQDQMAIYRNTTKFINERIEAIARELSDVELDGESYMTKYDFSDILMNEKSLYDRTLVNEKKLIDSEIELELVDFLFDYLNNHPSNDELLPTNLGFTDLSINDAANEFNKLALEKNRLLSNSSSKNPAVKKLEIDLQSIRSSLSSSLLNLKSSLKMEVSRLRSMDSELGKNISNLPKHKRILRSIERQQLVKESLYVYLLQKREENEIASAVTEGNSKIIEAAYSNGKATNPNKKIHYSLAIFFGLFIPFSTIYLRHLLDNKVRGVEDLEKHNLPHLANIPKVDGRQKLVISKGNNSSAAEAFRILRTNTSFVLGPNTDGGKIIIATSSIAKEGKSFVALNLATSYALTGKKTLVVELDLRAPKLFEYAELKPDKGVTDYIIDDSVSIESLLVKSPRTEGLSLLSSGTKPPNPSEILMRDEIKVLFAYLKQNFDIIIVDTAPVGLVTDTLLISDMADACIYVVRANYLEKKLLGIPERLRNEGKLKNIGVVINSVEHIKSGRYGYGYGYGYGYEAQSEQKKWFNKLFNRS